MPRNEIVSRETWLAAYRALLLRERVRRHDEYEEKASTPSCCAP
jgi:hypothetical protein